MEAALEEIQTVIEELPPAVVVAAVEEASVETKVNIVENVDTKTKIDILNEVNTDTKVKLLKNVLKTILVEFLPDVDTEEFKKIPAEVRLSELTDDVSAEVITPQDNEPDIDPNQPDPVIVEMTPTKEVIQISPKGQGWVSFFNSPAPIDSLLAEFSREIANVRVSLEDVPEKPSEVPDLPEDQIVSEYFRIDTENVEPGDILTARMGFYVEKSWLEANNIHKWAVKLNRFNEETGEWVARPAKKVGEDDTKVHYTTVLPGLSLFAVSGSEALPPIQFSVSDLAIVPGEVLEGDRVTMSARVTNLTDKDLVFPASLWLNNTIESAREITLSAGATTFFFFVVEKPVGTYNVRVDRLLGQFTVAPIPTPVTPTPVTPTPVTPVPVTPTPITPTPVTPVPVTPTPTATATPIPTSAATVVPVTPTPTPTLEVVPSQRSGGFPAWLIIVLVFIGAVLLIAGAGILWYNR